MNKEFKVLWGVISLLAVIALLAMTSGCTPGATQTLTTTTTVNKTSTLSVPAPNPGFVEQKPAPPPPPGGAAAPSSSAAAPAGGAQPKPSSAPGGAPDAGGVKPAGSSFYQPSASKDPAPPGVFTDKSKGTYYGPGKSPPFTLKIPANKNANGDWAACEDDGTLPVEYTCNGSGQSPPLVWSGAPVGTKEFALVVWHKPPDYAERGAKYYWIMWGIKGTETGLPQNAGAKDTKYGFLGLNEQKQPVFEPSCSSGPGLKTYIYTLYALDDSPQFEKLKMTKNAAGGYDGVTRDIFMQAIRDVTLCSTVMRVNTDVGNPGTGAAKPPAPAPAK